MTSFQQQVNNKSRQANPFIVANHVEGLFREARSKPISKKKRKLLSNNEGDVHM